jgi:succinylarginine dihydrolase
MASHYHRGIESFFTTKILQKIFHNDEFFTVHNFFPSQQFFGDEGAANHMLVSQEHGKNGDHIFVYGESHKNSLKPKKFLARQSLLASHAVARLHKINENNLLFLQQSPEAIEQGVFHNDVIAMNTTRRMIVHTESFTPIDQHRLQDFVKTKRYLAYREILPEELSIAEAVETYFFNSQLLDLMNDRFALIAPSEAEAHPKARALIYKLIEEGVFSEVYFRDLRESMRNGGGPACLRLRIVLTPQEAAAIHPGIILTENTFRALKQWVTTHYRDRLTADDLRDPLFVEELMRAYRALEEIIAMPGLYRDQMCL